MTTSNRFIYANQLVLDQADFFEGDGYTRVVGLTPLTVSLSLFFNNVLQVWPFVSGDAVADGQVLGGNVYLNEIPGTSGFYSLRFRPNAVGYWRVSLAYPDGLQVVNLDYDVVAVPPTISQGLKPSFTPPGS